MAAASVLRPSLHYQSPYSGAANSSEPPPQPGGDTNDAPARQSLPSFSEVISGAPHYISMPPQPSSGGLPSLFAHPSRQDPDSDKHSHSPQPLHSASFVSRQDTILAFADSSRTPFSGRPGLLPVTNRRPTAPGKPDGPSHGPVHHDHRSVSGGYSQPHAPTSHPYQPSHMPPGQVPLPVYPISPGHERYDAPRPQTHGESGPYAGRRYEQAPRHYENWTSQESFSEISTHSRTIFNFAEAYGRAAQEQQGGPPTIERLPSEREVNEMLANVDYIKICLEQARDFIQHTERAREAARAKGAYEESHDVNMYNDGMKPHYPVNEAKKRRGRAPPPGRCHSCNRIDTPEWRRGPNGARTLCNACGLHYAKLERKRQLEARSLQPQTEERN